MSDMVEAGVDRPELEELRRESGKMPPQIFKYKASLIAHTEFAYEGKIAWVMVPQLEINQYSPLYNPGPLIQNDILQTSGVQTAIVFKRYDDGRVTAAIRCNPQAGIAADLAKQFGGGGHAFASGFKVTDGRSFEQIKDDCLKVAEQLLDKNESKN
jgi:nanoRNase/pAp phosphatase (c-di-AMP/oligoRNAs hydrolase)